MRHKKNKPNRPIVVASYTASPNIMNLAKSAFEGTGMDMTDPKTFIVVKNTLTNFLCTVLTASPMILVLSGSGNTLMIMTSRTTSTMIAASTLTWVASLMIAKSSFPWLGRFGAFARAKN